MDPSNVGSSSFQAYEGIRILVPGVIVVALYDALIKTFDRVCRPSENAFAAAVAALFIGLFLRRIDVPTRSATYRKDLPGAELHAWPIEMKKSERGDLYSYSSTLRFSL